MATIPLNGNSIDSSLSFISGIWSRLFHWRLLNIVFRDFTITCNKNFWRGIIHLVFSRHTINGNQWPPGTWWWAPWGQVTNPTIWLLLLTDCENFAKIQSSSQKLFNLCSQTYTHFASLKAGTRYFFTEIYTFSLHYTWPPNSYSIFKYLPWT